MESTSLEKLSQSAFFVLYLRRDGSGGEGREELGLAIRIGK